MTWIVIIASAAFWCGLSWAIARHYRTSAEGPIAISLVFGPAGPICAFVLGRRERRVQRERAEYIARTDAIAERILAEEGL